MWTEPVWTEPNVKNLLNRTETNNFVTFQRAGHANVSLALISNWRLDGKYITCKKFRTILISDKNSVRK